MCVRAAHACGARCPPLPGAHGAVLLPKSRGVPTCALGKPICLPLSANVSLAAMPIINILHGGILVLTTKYSSIDAYAELLQQICPERKSFTQQKGVNIEHTVQEFIRVQQQEQQEAILVGTQSCWTGLNLQGRLLRLILIDKLPFDPPSLKQSLLKDMYYNGRQSTVDYFKGEYLPNMLLKLKQGSGRLIRSEQDWGVVVLMCNSIPKSYNNYVYRTFIPIPVIQDHNLTPIIEFVLNKQHAEQMSKSTLWSHFANTSRTK